MDRWPGRDRCPWQGCSAEGPARSTLLLSRRRPQVGDAGTACCSVAGLTPLTRRDFGVVPGMGRGRRQPFASAEPEPRLIAAVRYRQPLAAATPKPTPTAALPREAERCGLPATNCSRWPGNTGPNPDCVPEPAGPGNTGGRLRLLGLEPSAPPPGRRPGPSRSANRDRAAGQRRQRPRRRTTPNTNTSTTTMISTHNHVDMAASLVGAGQFAVTLLPPTRASNSVTARRPPGRDRRPLHAGPRGSPLPADLGWPDECS